MPETWREGEYKGNPTIEVLLYITRDGDEKWFSFGLNKAKAILNNQQAIKDFVAKYDK